MSSSLRAFAGVNLIASDSAQSTGSGVSASAEGGGSSASASVSPGGRISIYASSKDASPLANAVADASFASGYIVNGASGGLPISFNFNLTGNLSANSDFGPVQLGQASIFVTGTMRSFSQSAGSSVNSMSSGANLSVISGTPLFRTVGGSSKSSNSSKLTGIQTRITPEITIEAKQKFQLTEQDAIDLQLDLKFSGPPENYDFPSLSGLVANAINRFGLPRLKLAPGIEVKVGFDVDYIFDSPLSFQSTLTQSGSISIAASATSSTLPGSSNEGTADYFNTLILESITVPKNYSLLDTTALSITFDTGVERQIFRQVDGEVLTGKDGDDLLTGGNKDDRLNGEGGNDRLLGLADSDTLIGGSGDDILFGNENDDLLYGNEGNDILSGNAGNDVLVGGEGQDRFQFGLGRRFNRTIGVDRVLDFVGGTDRISLERSTFRDIKRINFSAVRTQLQAQRSSAQIVYIRRTGSLFYNQNGEKAGFGTGGQFADFEDGLLLSKRSFIRVA